jgi:hypothetical protein
MAVETVRGYGRQSRHHLRTFLPAVWHYQSVARNSYGTSSAVLKSLGRRIISAPCQDRWPVRWIWMHFSMPWVRPGYLRHAVWNCGHVLHLCWESSKTRILKLYISGPAGTRRNYHPAKAQPAYSPFSSPFNGYLTFHQLAKTCLSFEGIWSKFDRIG